MDRVGSIVVSLLCRLSAFDLYHCESVCVFGQSNPTTPVRWWWILATLLPLLLLILLINSKKFPPIVSALASLLFVALSVALFARDLFIAHLFVQGAITLWFFGVGLAAPIRVEGSSAERRLGEHDNSHLGCSVAICAVLLSAHEGCVGRGNTGHHYPILHERLPCKAKPDGRSTTCRRV
jgi:hypothetical protein